MKIIKDVECQLSDEELGILVKNLTEGSFELQPQEFLEKYGSLELPERALQLKDFHLVLFAYAREAREFTKPEYAHVTPNVTYLIHFLAENNYNFNIYNEKGFTVLMKAVKNHHLDYVQLLLGLKNPPDVNLGQREDMVEKHRLTPLNEALRRPAYSEDKAETRMRYELATLLLSKGAVIHPYMHKTFGDDVVFTRIIKEMEQNRIDSIDARTQKIEQDIADLKKMIATLISNKEAQPEPQSPRAGFFSK